MVWRSEDPQGSEAHKIRWELPQWTRGKVLDVGCGPAKPFDHFIGVDNNVDAHLFGIQARPNIFIQDAGKLDIFAGNSFDSVFSSHLLEHIEPERVPEVLKEWWRLLKVGGYLVLYLPHEDFYPKVGEPGANPDHKWNVNPKRVMDYMKELKFWDLLENQERNEGTEYSLFQVYKKTGFGRNRELWNEPKPSKTCGLVRYGAFGDLMQASSIIKGLKDQGYHVTLYTSPPGSDVITHDPNIDKIYFQDKDQVPNPELGSFWDWQKKKYDKWVNLSESVEGTLLAMPGRTQFLLPPKLREQMLNRNYLEFQHEMAGVPHKPNIRFYPTEEERKWARKQREKMGNFVLLWTLAGSSVHKTWPYVDNVVAALMQSHPDIHVVFTGGPDCQILEAGWENEPRVHKTSGKWTIRQTLSFIDQSDCLIGPETGVLNAASCLSMPKIVFLSHSSHENLTRDWINCYPLSANHLKCSGRGNDEATACHQMHFSWSTCSKDFDPECKACQEQTCTEHTVTALCQKAITADRVTDVLNVILEEHFRKAA